MIDTAGAQSVSAVMAAINAQSDTTGVTASRSSTNVNTATYQSSFTVSTVTINDVAVAIPASATVKQVVEAMNNVTSRTGVTVTSAGNILRFTSEGGADLQLADDDSFFSGVLLNYNGISTLTGLSATFSAGITLTSQSLSGITVSEGSGTTANDLQLLPPGITIVTTSDIPFVGVAGGLQSYSFAAIGSASVSGGDLILDNVILDFLVVAGGTVTITNSIVKEIIMSGGTVNATGSAIGNKSGPGTLNNTSPVAMGSPSAPQNKTLKVSTLDIGTVSGASDAIRTADLAMQKISGERAKLGALQSRFETAVSNLQITSENLSASRSRILDADFAAETAALSRAQILQQAGTAMVAQANQLPQGILALLR